jgi:hypothetical protein
LGNPVRPSALLGQGLTVMQIIEEFSRVGHGGRRYYQRGSGAAGRLGQ